MLIFYVLKPNFRKIDNGFAILGFYFENDEKLLHIFYLLFKRILIFVVWLVQFSKKEPDFALCKTGFPITRRIIL